MQTHNDALQLQSSLVTFSMTCISNLKLSYSRTKWYSQITILQIPTEIRQRLLWFLDWACYGVINRSDHSLFLLYACVTVGFLWSRFDWQQDGIDNHVQIQFLRLKKKEASLFLFLIKVSFCHRQRHKGDLRVSEYLSFKTNNVKAVTAVLEFVPFVFFFHSTTNL